MREMMKRVLMLSLLVLVTGCQTGKAPVSNSNFMGLWTVYNRCQSSSDLDTMRIDVRQLQDGSQVETMTTAKDDPIRPFLRPIERWITPPITRLAADPKAMAASCMLYTGQAAVTFGRMDVASEMFSAVIQHFPQPQYSYYTDQARVMLAQLNAPTPISLTAVRPPLPTLLP
jgi:hypothetical protein